jgi:hypothetical protein
VQARRFSPSQAPVSARAWVLRFRFSLRRVSLGLFFRSLLGLGLSRVLDIVGDFAVHIDDQDFGAHRDHFTRLADDGFHHAVHRAGNFDRGLVGHHIEDVLVFRDLVAGLDVPFDDFRLDDAFAHIGELVLVFAHAQASVTVFIARAKRSRVGKYAHSWACG